MKILNKKAELGITPDSVGVESDGDFQGEMKFVKKRE